ncbi:hypothetical protein MKEN_00312800 [Mycena kentingensis (nom. inval.)]|nr:hypothetical protein MKEN_00312800 [Mycena kentingensis (nom. inval.)]
MPSTHLLPDDHDHPVHQHPPQPKPRISAWTVTKTPRSASAARLLQHEYPEPYVREATAADLDEISAFSARAFHHDPEMNWFGGLRFKADSTEAEEAQSLKNLGTFLDMVHRSVLIVGGRINVVALPQGAAGPEKLVAYCAWVPPNKVVEGTLTTVRARGHRILSKWGLGFVWRATAVFKPRIATIVKKSLKSKGFGTTDHFRIEITATDPDYQGRGFSTLLMKDGIAVSDASKPITLEATTAHSRDIYAHQGFELIETLKLGAGDVDVNGYKVTDKQKAVGFDVYVMARWPSSRIPAATRASGGQ